jgi:subtilase family serine protease
MTPQQFPEYRSAPFAYAALVCAVAVLSACGGGSGGDAQLAASTTPQPAVASAITTLELDPQALPEAAAQQFAQPTFHVAPVQLQAPADVDAQDPSASAYMAPHTQTVSPELAALSTRRLTPQALQAGAGQVADWVSSQASEGAPTRIAAGSAVATYTPAQIRAAYGLPALPAAGSALTAAQAAQLGAGQTIYIVDAHHNPNAAAELAAFNAKFGLPACTTKAIAPTAKLPLPAASKTACEFSVVYNTASGTMTSAVPAYNAGWATEIALDVQWAHAIAPLARIVLIESADASLNSLLGGIKLANAMGPGVVSMSFGANEGNWTASVDGAFTGAGMSYLAATGDSGVAVSWPSVSNNVLAVGGTSLTYTGSGARSETGWSSTGGGISAYTATPSYQSNAVPGMGTRGRRAVADVAFNADPSTGQYVATMAPGAATASWISAGGTSLSTPQWAGIVAIANANRALAAKAVLGSPHAVLYGQIATVPGTYASTFADIKTGAHGGCATCTATAGYDQLTGLGTPQVGSLLNVLSGASAASMPPVVTPATISGKVGTALSFTVSVTAPNAVTYALSGAPAGMAISATGAVTWAKPVAGTYTVTVTAKDSKTGLSGQGKYTVVIAAQVAATAPVVTAGSVSGRPGVALSFATSATAPNAVSYTLTGAPAGMAINTSGVVSWASPVLGTYAVTVTAKDTKTGLSGQGVYTVKIVAAGPVITAAPMTGVAGKQLTGTITIADPGATSLSISLTGVPMGMGFAINGLTLTAIWPSPVRGTYSMQVKVVDNAGLSATQTIPITIN